MDVLKTVDPYMNSVISSVKKIATASSPVLLWGEMGTGKAALAELIHTFYEKEKGSPPFLDVECASMDQDMGEYQIFGREDARTGGFAVGLLEQAAGGMLCLREIDALDVKTQILLLSAIEEGYFTRSGGHIKIPFDVRIVATLNGSPEEKIEQGMLRRDLYHKLGVNTFYISPLRRRICDIEPLAEEFMTEGDFGEGRRVRGFGDGVKKAFERYPWPGNIEELFGVLKGAANLCEGDLIELSDLPDHIAGTDTAPGSQDYEKIPKGSFVYDNRLTYQENIEEMERLLLSEKLRHFASKQEAAAFLGMSKQTLNYRLNKLGLK